MNLVELMTISGRSALLPSAEIQKFATGIRGQVLRREDADYDAARRIWNGMIDRYPGLIVRCANTADVVQAVNFARENRLLLAVRSGGHNIAGSALCDDGIVIDLSQMKTAGVDVGRRRVVIEAGATLADLDAATQPYGLAVPVGINSTTGIAGLTLGGGFGWLSRKYGMTIDSLEAATIVTAEGEVLRVSANEHPSLFWAIRGGGGNFGIVTRFEFRLHPVGPDALSGLIVYPLSEAKSVLQQYRAFLAKAPDELSVWAVMRKAPPLPFLPAEVHGTEMLALALLYTGDPETGQTLIEPLRRFGNPLGEHIGVQPYAAWQQAFDPLLTAGARNYWKSLNFTAIQDGLFDVLLEYTRSLPSPQCEIFLAGLGGAASRIAPDATAYAHRDAQFVINVHGRWTEIADDIRCIQWARDFYKAALPFAGNGVYVNFLTADEGERIPTAYGPNFERLTQVKRVYDPENLFRMNQNISPV